MITIDIQSMVTLAAATLGTVALLAALVLARSVAKLRARCLQLEAALPPLQREVELISSVSARTGRQMKRIAHDYSNVAERIDQVQLSGPVRSLGEAIDSARRGADSGKLSQQFGLSRGEAELVARLHGKLKRA